MNNPILDELHAIRRQMLADAGGTLAGLVAKIQADQAKSDRVIIENAGTIRCNRAAKSGVLKWSINRRRRLIGDVRWTHRVRH